MIAHGYSRASGQEDALARKILVVRNLHEFHETCHSVTFIVLFNSGVARPVKVDGLAVGNACCISGGPTLKGVLGGG